MKWRCMECDVVFESDTTRHSMDYCPECEDEWVDHEEHYTRRSMGVERVSA